MWRTREKKKVFGLSSFLVHLFSSFLVRRLFSFLFFLIQVRVLGGGRKPAHRTMDPLLCGGADSHWRSCFATRGSSLRRKETAPTREVLRLSSKRRGRGSKWVGERNERNHGAPCDDDETDIFYFIIIDVNDKLGESIRKNPFNKLVWILPSGTDILTKIIY